MVQQPALADAGLGGHRVQANRVHPVLHQQSFHGVEQLITHGWFPLVQLRTVQTVGPMLAERSGAFEVEIVRPETMG
ncbi:hypothetical protein GCM10009664_42160 [Kitasatospora gansuensis]